MNDLKSNIFWINSSTYYQSEQLLKILIHAALEKSSVEVICSTSSIFPSPDTMMTMLAKTHGEKTRDLLEERISSWYQFPITDGSLILIYES